METEQGLTNYLPASEPVGSGVDAASQQPQSAAPEPGEENVLPPVDTRSQELEAENQRLKQAMSGVEQWAQTLTAQQQQQAEENAFKKREEKIQERAALMSRDDAERYIADEYRTLATDKVRVEQERASKSEQMWQDRLRTAVRPQWVDSHIKQNGLTDSEREYLTSLDPDTVPVVAKYMAQSRRGQEELRQQIEQLTRTQQAGTMQANGLGNVGGVTPSYAPGELPSDPDDRALAIYHQLMGNRS